MAALADLVRPGGGGYLALCERGLPLRCLPHDSASYGPGDETGRRERPETARVSAVPITV
ncbi:MAG: hypothetical protein ACRDYU_14815 [Actinomycetes bacterium]